MNLVQYNIVKVNSVTDISEKYEAGLKKYDPEFVLTEPMLSVNMVVDCYGVVSEKTQQFKKSEWQLVEKQRYYFG